MRAIYFLLFLIIGCDSNNQILNGYIEGEYQYITSTNSGILNELYVERGNYIKSGSPLFALEDLEFNIAIENAKAEIRQAEAALREDMKDYIRNQKFLKSQLIGQAELDKAEALYAISKEKVDIAKRNLITAQKKLYDSAPKATDDCYVEDTFFTPGEFVNAGIPVVSLLSSQHIKIRFFIPQKRLPEIAVGKNVMISCDGCKKKIKAKIVYIAKQAEYAPPVIYSADSRQKMVFMVEAKVDKLEPYLHPGLPVDVELEG